MIRYLFSEGNDGDHTRTVEARFASGSSARRRKEIDDETQQTDKAERNYARGGTGQYAIKYIAKYSRVGRHKHKYTL